MVVESHLKEFQVVVFTETPQNCKWPCLGLFLGHALLFLVIEVCQKIHLDSLLSVYSLIPTTFTILCVYFYILLSN